MIGQRKSQCKPEVRVVGIDASLTGTGVCCSKDGIFNAMFLPESKLRGADRLLSLRNRLFQLIDAFKPELVVIEGYSYGSVGKDFEIGELGGVIKVELREREIPFEVVSPKSLKKFMGVKRDGKELMVAAVKNRLKFDVGNNDNLADATALARVAEVIITNETKYRSELEVVRDMATSKVPKKHEKFPKCRGML